MNKLYAFYERAPTGWNLVVYHDEVPPKGASGAPPERVGPYMVPTEMIDVDGSPNFGMIFRAFPHPNRD